MRKNIQNNGWNALEILAIIVGGGIAIYLIIVAVGTAISLVLTGLATTGVIASYIIPVLTICCGIGAAGGGVWVLVKISDKVKEKPYQWLMPILAIAAAFITDLCKEIYSGSNLLKISFAAMTALLFLGGGNLLKIPCHVAKIAAVVMFILPPAIVSGLLVREYPDKGFPQAIVQADISTYFGLGGLFLIFALITILAYLTKHDFRSF